jgi:hypothetical protein
MHFHPFRHHSCSRSDPCLIRQNASLKKKRSALRQEVTSEKRLNQKLERVRRNLVVLFCIASALLTITFFALVEARNELSLERRSPSPSFTAASHVQAVNAPPREIEVWTYGCVCSANAPSLFFLATDIPHRNFGPYCSQTSEQLLTPK